MPQRDFEITIGPEGNVELTVKGHKGRACLDVARMFEQIVGEMASQRLTSEYYEPEEPARVRQSQQH